jgi:dolichol-phosphate mannosyltransferase
VDDNSRDGSVEEVEALREEGYNIRIIVRTNERGLSSAVVRGFKEAKGDAMICMDADLQVYAL